MLRELAGGDRPERVEPNVERHPLDIQPREHLRREMQARRWSRGRALLLRIDGLVPLGIFEPLRDVWRQRRLPRRLALEPQAPAPLAERLHELDRPKPLPHLQPP